MNHTKCPTSLAIAHAVKGSLGLLEFQWKMDTTKRKLTFKDRLKKKTRTNPQVHTLDNVTQASAPKDLLTVYSNTEQAATQQIRDVPANYAKKLDPNKGLLYILLLTMVVSLH